MQPRVAPNNLVISLPLPYASLAQHANTVRKTGTSNDEICFATFQMPRSDSIPETKREKQQRAHKNCFKSYKII